MGTSFVLLTLRLFFLDEYLMAGFPTVRGAFKERGMWGPSPSYRGEEALATSSSLVGRGRSSRASLLSLRGDGGCAQETPRETALGTSSDRTVRKCPSATFGRFLHWPLFPTSVGHGTHRVD